VSKDLTTLTTDPAGPAQGAPFDGKSLFAAGFFGAVMFVGFDMILSLISSPELSFSGSRHGLTTVTLILGHGSVLGVLLAIGASLLGLFSFNRTLPWHPGVLIPVLVLGAAYLKFSEQVIPANWIESESYGLILHFALRLFGLIAILGFVLTVRHFSRQARESWAARLGLFTGVAGLLLAQKSGAFKYNAAADFAAFMSSLVLCCAIMASILSRFPFAIRSALILLAIFLCGSILVRLSDGFSDSVDASRILAQWTDSYAGPSEWLFRLIVGG
jgi:hypothetical protein